jgi:hypothetical protein
VIDLAHLRSVGDPIAKEYLPGWDVRWVLCTQEQIDTLVPGALAVCRAKDATPTRSIAICYVIADWPASEKLAETLWHELTHAVVSPLIALIPESAASIMLEEQIVERIGKVLARIPMGARRAVIKSINECAPRLRARVSALAPRARSGGTKMDPIDLIIAAVEAAANADDPKQAINDLLAKVKAMKGGGPAPESTGEETPMPDANTPPPAKLPAEGAEKDPAADPEMARLRGRMKADAAELATIKNDALATAKSGLVDTLRARLPGHTGLAATEAKILRATTYQGAKDIAEIAIDMGGGATRARSGVGVGSAPDTTKASGEPAVAASALAAEGFAPAWIANYERDHVKDPKLAAHGLESARARMKPNASPWLPATPASGGAK